MQNKINLTITDRMVNRSLIYFSDLADFYQLAFFRTCFKWSKNRGFFLHAHIAVITAVMVPGNCLKSILAVFCHKLAYIGCMETGCLCHFAGLCSFCSKL